MNQEILSALKIVAVTFLCSALIMPGMKKIAFHIGALDIPRSDEGNRHIHKRVMPKLGGVGIFLAFLVGYVIWNRKYSNEFDFDREFYNYSNWYY